VGREKDGHESAVEKSAVQRETEGTEEGSAHYGWAWGNELGSPVGGITVPHFLVLPLALLSFSLARMSSVPTTDFNYDDDDWLLPRPLKVY
jgi:hypothetical protein